jgi:5-methyltetrahydropteroyltriglutamate--homocysteine methyltransferase
LKEHYCTLIKKSIKNIKIILANYFDCFGENLATALSLPVHTLHLDLVRCPLQLDDILNLIYFQIAPLSLELSMAEISGKMISKNQLL